MPQRDQPAPFLTLERKLPILIGGLVALVLIATIAMVRAETRGSALSAAEDRLVRVTSELQELADSGLFVRRRIMAGVADSTAVAPYLAGEAVPQDSVIQLLERLRASADSALPILLVSRSGEVVLRTPASVEHAAPPPGDIAPVADTGVVYGPLTDIGGRAGFWNTVPVRSGGQVLGHVYQLRGIANRPNEALSELVGTDVTGFIAGAGGRYRAGLLGDATQYSVDVERVDTAYVQETADGTRDLVFARRLRNADWIVASRIPVERVLAYTDLIAKRIALLGLFLMLLGGVAAWLLSRSVTVPLRRLGAAADAVANGDFARRTGIRSCDEIGQLAASFEEMADRIGYSHRELARRYREAQTLAAELESTNARLNQAMEESAAAQQEASVANRAKSEFLATMSHEIRTPINAVIGYTELLQMGLPGELNPQQLEFMARIRMSGEHLISLVNDVLDFAKLESGQLRVARELGSAGDDVQRAASMMEGRAEARHITIRTDVPPDALYFGDSHRVQQIMLNVISNATKFSPEGGEIRIWSERRRSHSIGDPDARHAVEWTCVHVQDQGPGVPPEQIERIFEPFVQGTAGYTRPHGGTGLGLAISRSLARMMDGEITVQSEPGVQTIFTLWLPRPTSAAALEEPQQQEFSPGTEPDASGPVPDGYPAHR